jgi:hypothetical protein
VATSAGGGRKRGGIGGGECDSGEHDSGWRERACECCDGAPEQRVLTLPRQQALGPCSRTAFVSNLYRSAQSMASEESS